MNSTTPKGFITDEMWIGSSDSSHWIETGDMDGSINGNYWAGHFAAYQPTDSTSYREFTIGPEYSGIGHSFEIQKTGYNTWCTYLDFNLTETFTMPNPIGAFMVTGIETNNTDSSFVSGCGINSLQYLGTDSIWHNWNAASNADTGYNGWTSAYNNNTNAVLYTHP